MMNQVARKDNNEISDVTSGLLSAAGLSVDRLPLLQIFFEQVCEDLLEQLQSLSDAKIELALQRVWTHNISQTNVRDDDHVIVQLDFAEGEPPAFVCFDRSALYLLLECMMGASGKEQPYTETRDFTVLEFLFAKTIAGRAGLAFCNVFHEIVEMSTSVSATVKGSLIDTLSDLEALFLTGNIVIEAFDRSGTINLLIPQGIFSSVKSQFQAVKPQVTNAADQPWQEHLTMQLQHTDMLCQASIDGGQLSLGAISRMRVGQILELDLPSDKAVRFSSNEEDLYWCELGQSDGLFTLKVTERISEKKDFLDEILGQQKSILPTQL